jgi:hypothetical protein
MAELRPTNWDTWNSNQKYAFASKANKVSMQLHNDFGAWFRGELTRETYDTFPQSIKDKYEYTARLSRADYGEFINVDFYRIDQAIQTAMASLQIDMEDDVSVSVDLDNDVVGE